MIARRAVLAGAAGSALAATLPAQAACPGAGGPAVTGRGFHLGEVFNRPARDFVDMAAAGADLVRLGIALRPTPDGEAYEWPARGVDELMRTLQLAGDQRMKVIPVLRPSPDPRSPLWRRESLQRSLVALWRELATRLRGQAALAALDLVNEAHPSGRDFAEKERLWAALAMQLIAAVRAVDPRFDIVYEPSPGARPMAFRTVEALPVERVIYSVHFYEPFEFSHQDSGDPRFVGAVDYPGEVPGQGRYDAARLRADLEPVRAFQRRSGAPIYVGEFGAVRWAPPGARERYLADLIALFQEYRWSWTYHAFREWQGWDAEVGAGRQERRRSADEPAWRLLRRALAECPTR
ncbi:cellulase family glycosylhydrolase [Rubrivivax gelatinosus]|uniref:Glycoside hydrolase family 5 domain-containing protein n=1 Tax=Rubrivivax gelatinosus TaxID=28068 RepID=A0ABS1DTN2_RUBGE|nr:hypothetical protein [Rubrivivax gelatinosus]